MNAPLRKKDRARWLHGKAYAFAARRGWWPSVPELCAFVGKPPGLRFTIWRVMTALRRNDLVRLDIRAWRVTALGFGYLQAPPITTTRSRRPPPKSKKRNAAARQRKSVRQADVVRIFDKPYVPTEDLAPLLRVVD